MNKSKFLKKSLAALLAVMLVVAMVPLSAAASADALPALTRIYVNDTEITANGTEFSANFAEDQAESTLKVTATLPAGTKLEAFESEESLTGTTINDSSSTINVKDYTGGGTEGAVYLKLSDTTSAGRPSVWYTLNLKQVNLDDASGVKGVSITSDGKNNGLLNATVDQENQTINVEAAYGHGTAGTITVIPTDGATVSNPVTVATDGTEFIVTAGGINTVWTIKVTEVEALLDFTVAGKQGVIDHDKKTITVNLTLDDIKDQYGDVEEDAVRAVEFSTITNTQIGWEATGASSLTTEIASGDKKALNDIQDNMKYEGVIWVKNGTSSTGVGYALTVQIPKNTGTEVLYAAIKNVEASIDGTNIKAVLNATETTADGTIRLHVSKGATISGLTGFAIDNTESTDEYDVYKTTTATEINTPDTKKTFVVTAADTSYSTQYSIWWTKADGQTEAALKSLNLKDGDNVYTGVVDEAKHTVTIEVPFMTTTLVPWKIFATYSAGAIGEYNGAPILSGITPVDAAVNLPANITDGTTQTITDFITVKSQGTVDVETNYALVVKFKKPNNNKKLTGMKVTVQDATTNDNAQKVARAMNDTNTYQATVKEPAFNADGSVKTGGKVTFETAYSQKSDSGLAMLVSEVTTNGGVAYIHTAGATTAADGGIEKFAKIDGDKNTDTDTLTNLYDSSIADNVGTWNTKDKVSIVVVPEEIAKVIDSGSAITPDQTKLCAFYEIELNNKNANTQGKLESLTIAGQTMRVVPGSNGTGVIMGTLPYSATVDATAAATAANNEKNSQFLEFSLSDYATLGKTQSTGKPTDDVFTNKGDTNGDGEANAIGDGNAKLVFVRGDDHNVDAYLVKDNTTAITIGTTDPDESIAVYSEAHSGASAPTNTYTFQLKYADANNQAAITEFDLNGYKGAISGTTINVSVPKATNLKALRASFKASTGATVYLDNSAPATPASIMESGKTVLNCSSDVKIYVRSEDESKTEVYTLKVTEGEMFVDVTKDDWFYEEVNTAANNGWINGTGEGYFTPYGSMTRGQFALIIARMEVKDFDEETEVDCPFPDVEGTAYRAAAKYVYDQGYMQGDGDNFFNANDNITRAQAAIVLCKMKGIEPMTGDTDYDDDASIADWAKGYVKAATAAGIFKGEGDDFNPQRYLRRCEGAAILVRSANK